MKKLKAARNAYIAGENGETVDLSRASKIERVAHKWGTKRGERLDALDHAMNAAEIARFEATLEKSKGSNKVAMDIIKVAGDIPRTTSLNVITTPLWGHASGHNDRAGNFVAENHSWNASFRFGAAEAAAGTQWDVDTVERLGSLTFNDEKIRVRDIGFNCVGQYGTDGRVGGVATTIWVNSADYGSVRLDIGSDGEPETIRREVPNGLSGYTDFDPATTNVDVDGLLNGVLSSVKHTAENYAQLSKSLDELPPGAS